MSVCMSNTYSSLVSEYYNPRQNTYVYSVTVTSIVVPMEKYNRQKQKQEGLLCNTPYRRLATPDFIDVWSMFKRRKPIVVCCSLADTLHLHLIEGLRSQLGVSKMNLGEKEFYEAYLFPPGTNPTNGSGNPLSTRVVSYSEAYNKKECFFIEIK